MSWRLVHRTEPIGAIGSMLRAQRPGPLIITGEPGIGRTTILAHAMELIDPTVDRPIVVTVPNGRPPLALPGGDIVTVAATIDGIRHASADRDAAGTRRPVFVVDDAHLADQSAVQLLREFHRRDGAVLLMSRPTGEAARKPDPLDCLQYEAGARSLPVPLLSDDEIRTITESAVDGPISGLTAAALAAATGGNPSLLHDLVVTSGLATAMERRDGQWQLPGISGPGAARVSERSRTRLLHSLRDAWATMSLARLDQLSRLTLWAGATDEAAPILAFVLLLCGRADDGIGLLDMLAPPQGNQAMAARDFMIRAMLLAFGTGRVDQAAELLAGTAHAVPDQRSRAALAWICAAVGHTEFASGALRDVGPVSDPKAAVFAWAADAALKVRADRPKDAVPLLRRAIIGTRAVRAELPWLSSYLTGVLIDALLLAGRVNEAMAAAADFHTAQEGRGWDVTVRLDTLIRSAGVRPGLQQVGASCRSLM